jgi:hypothetical protein
MLLGLNEYRAVSEYALYGRGTGSELPIDTSLPFLCRCLIQGLNSSNNACDLSADRSSSVPLSSFDR